MIGTCWPILVLLAGASCGWHPVYVSDPARGMGVSALLGQVDVAIIPERQGQLLRQALQARLRSDVAGTIPEFRLQTIYSVQTEGLAITSQSAVTRFRLVATASYVLRSVSQPRTCLSGSVTSVDGLDVENQQFFASDLETETVQRRLADAVAEQIVLKLALAFGSSKGTGCEGR